MSSLSSDDSLKSENYILLGSTGQLSATKPIRKKAYVVANVRTPALARACSVLHHCQIPTVTWTNDETFCCTPAQHSCPSETVTHALTRIYSSTAHPDFIPSAVDYAVKIRVNPEQTGIDLNVKHSMARASPTSVLSHLITPSTQNPFDEIGVSSPSPFCCL